MKLLVYGTGSRAKRYFEFRYSAFFEVNDILAFVDKDNKKWGELFYNRPIISPGEINNYIFDYIVIASAYEEEIEQQLVDEYLIERKKIKKNKDINLLDELLVEHYERKYNLTNKNVIGLYYDGYENLEYVKAKCEAYMGITEFYNYNEIIQNSKMRFDFIILLDPKRANLFDWNDEKYKLENKIISILIDRGINETCILRSSVLYSYSSVSRRITYGNSNQDKTFLKISFPSNPGLVTIVYRAIRGIKYAYRNGYIPVVDCQLYKSQYHEIEEIGKVNAWEKFFEQPTQYSMEDVLNSFNVISYGEFDGEEVVTADDIREYLKPKSNILEKINNYCDEFGIGTGNNKVLGCLCRGSDYTKIKPYNHSVQPTLDQLIEKVKEIYSDGKYNKIYLCSETQEAVERFRKEFKDKVIYYNQERCDEYFDQYLSEFKSNSAYLWGENYWVAINVLAKCDALVGGRCGGTIYANTINEGKYEEVFIFDLGKYKC